MKKNTTVETLSGTLQQLLFSPKGVIEGLLLTVRGKPVQISMAPGTVDVSASALIAGQRIVVKASADHSPKTKSAGHPVFKLEAVVKIAGKAMRVHAAGVGPVVLKGVVAALHYARHGQPNGVVLESGEFIHLRPHGMEQLGLQVGAEVVAHGELRMTVLGTKLLEARELNRVNIA